MAFKVNKQKVLSWERYELALLRFRDFIVKGRPLVLDDSEEIGNKHTNCSWGLCESGDRFGKESWPDAEDHVWPDLFPERIAPLNQQDGQWCPFDRRAGSPVKKSDYHIGTFGCFFHCRVFRPTEARITKEKALQLYDVQIQRLRARHQ